MASPQIMSVFRPAATSERDVAHERRRGKFPPRFNQRRRLYASDEKRPGK
jgi:hypothetical protein